MSLETVFSSEIKKKLSAGGSIGLTCFTIGWVVNILLALIEKLRDGLKICPFRKKIIMDIWPFPGMKFQILKTLWVSEYALVFILIIKNRKFNCIFKSLMLSSNLSFKTYFCKWPFRAHGIQNEFLNRGRELSDVPP